MKLIIETNHQSIIDAIRQILMGSPDITGFLPMKSYEQVTFTDKDIIKGAEIYLTIGDLTLIDLSEEINKLPNGKTWIDEYNKAFNRKVG